MWSSVKSWLRWFLTWEPAQFRALWGAVANVLASLGLGQWVANIDVRVQVAITAVAALIPFLQGLWTRQAVSPAIKVEGLQNALSAAVAGQEKAAAPQVPGSVGVDQAEPYER